ncbi:MAG: ribosomal protein S18-alanine N-acetyltransferase [Eubacteriales bacterium]|nr:ribosomal protein S18-alanine N-acetyltransferase [Eubacteriales bacterium]MDD4390878.1 ribosomal protein S18-alanine N-acetyltransferase [Eubacteriales bacterium]
MKEINIRFAVPGDAEEIAEIDAICFALPWSSNALQEDIAENEKAVYIVAEQEDKILGYAGMWIIFDEAHITNVAVRPEFRRLGLGRIIVVTLLSEAVKHGTVCQTLEVRVSNIAAINLYESLGFKGVGVRKGYYSDNNEDALIMWRSNE